MITVNNLDCEMNETIMSGGEGGWCSTWHKSTKVSHAFVLQ